jgi:hypothetical protein
VEVVVDVDLAVGSTADEDEPVDLDHIIRSSLFDRVPITARGVRVQVGGDVQVDWSLAVRSHGSLLLIGDRGRAQSGVLCITFPPDPAESLTPGGLGAPSG